MKGLFIYCNPLAGFKNFGELLKLAREAEIRGPQRDLLENLEEEKEKGVLFYTFGNDYGLSVCLPREWENVGGEHHVLRVKKEIRGYCGPAETYEEVKKIVGFDFSPSGIFCNVSKETLYAQMEEILGWSPRPSA